MYDWEESFEALPETNESLAPFLLDPMPDVIPDSSRTDPFVPPLVPDTSYEVPPVSYHRVDVPDGSFRDATAPETSSIPAGDLEPSYQPAITAEDDYQPAETVDDRVEEQSPSDTEADDLGPLIPTIDPNLTDTAKLMERPLQLLFRHLPKTEEELDVAAASPESGRAQPASGVILTGAQTPFSPRAHRTVQFLEQ